MGNIKHYTYAHFSKGKLFLRGFDDAWNPLIEEVNYQPTVWVDPDFSIHPWKNEIVSVDTKTWKSFIGHKPLVALKFDSIGSCKQFVSKNRIYGKDVDGKMQIVGEKVYTPPSNMFIAQYLCENFTTESVPANKVRVYTYDIETEVGHRNVDDDTEVTIRRIVDRASMEEQKEEITTVSIIDYERMVDKEKWELLNDESGEWVSYGEHPYRFIGGFPEPTKANEKITLITVKDVNNKKIYTWGLENFYTDRTDIFYFKCKNEEELLMSFLGFWTKDYPDVVSGWNTAMFDNTYMVNRIKRVLGVEQAKRLSPFGEIISRPIKDTGDIETSFAGIANLDYLKLYRKFNTKAQENYKLDTIAGLEVGFKKVENPTGGTFRDFYTGEFEVRNKPSEDATEIRKLGYSRTLLHDKMKEDSSYREEYENLNKKIIAMCKQLFIEYNIRDVELVDKIDNKRKFIGLAMTIAYSAKCNYEDIFSPVKTWDYIIYNNLNADNIVVPMKKAVKKDEKFDGAYVKPPLVGKHEFCESFDLDSLYPHIIMEYNISPETIIRKKDGEAFVNPLNLDKLINKTENTNLAHKYNVSMASSGVCFTKKRIGILPHLCETFYAERKANKRKYLHYQSEYEKILIELRNRGLKV